jgi:C_GCAxxG_C_C family probable redox protein
MDICLQSQKKAFEYHQSGFHCAEAVSKTIVENFGKYSSLDVPKVATAFGGGIGRSKDEICGGLAGAFIAIGFLYGRDKSDSNWDKTADLASKLRDKFIRKYGTTKCSILLESFGDQDNMMKCKKLSGEIAYMVADLIEEAKE